MFRGGESEALNRLDRHLERKVNQVTMLKSCATHESALMHFMDNAGPDQPAQSCRL